MVTSGQAYRASGHTETIDPVTFSVVFHRLQTINKEMGITMVRTSRSSIFAEVHDFSCAICDWVPRIVAQVDGVPSHTASSMTAAKAIAETFKGDINPGDVFLINDAYNGGTHLPDVALIKPVFYEGQLLFMAINRAHHEDVGGLSPGSYSPLATEIFHEGIRIPPLRIYRNNEPIKDVIELVRLNTRQPEVLWSDIKAQVASCAVAEKRLIELVDQYGVDKTKAVMNAVQEYAEQRMRQEIQKMPDGEYEGEVFLDDDGFDAKQIRIKVTVKISGDEMLVDFAGTDPQTKGPMNSPFANSATSVYVAVLTTTSSDVPRTEGAYKPIKIQAPLGTIVNPTAPGAVASCTLDTACAILEAMWMALSKAIPDRAPAGWNRKCGPSFSGIDPRRDEFFIQYCFAGLGGAGAMPHADGLAFVSDGIDLGGLMAPNIESIELECPETTLVHELLTDSGGAGKFRGGPGIHYKIRWHCDNVTASIHGDGKVNPPYGLFGGRPGRTNLPIVNEGTSRQEELPSKGVRYLGAEDTYTLYASGGGGWGDPLDRDVEKVREDVLNEFVSRASAHDDYGVILDDRLQIDHRATEERRTQLRSQRNG